MLYVNRLILHGDGLFHGNDVHSYTGAAHRDHRSDFLQREEGHALEEHRQFRVAVHKLRVHVGVLGGAGNEHRDPVDTVLTVVCGSGDGTVIRVLVAIVVLEHSEIGKLVQQIVEGLVVRSVVLGGIPLVQ